MGGISGLFYRWKILVKMTLCCCFSIINTTTKHDQDDVLHQNFHQDKNLWNILNCEQPKFFEISDYSEPDKNVRNIFRTSGPNMNIFPAHDNIFFGITKNNTNSKLVSNFFPMSSKTNQTHHL